MTSASPGNLGPVTGVWLFFWGGGEKVGISWGFWAGLRENPLWSSVLHHTSFVAAEMLSPNWWALADANWWVLYSPQLVGPHLLKVDLNLLHQPSQSCPESQGPWGVPSGFPAIFKASQESHIYHRPCCWLVDPVLNTGLLWITSVGMAGAGSCLKCLKFRGGHHGETNKNIKKKTRSVTVLLEKILHPLFS